MAREEIKKGLATTTNYRSRHTLESMTNHVERFSTYGVKARVHKVLHIKEDVSPEGVQPYERKTLTPREELDRIMGKAEY